MNVRYRRRADLTERPLGRVVFLAHPGRGSLYRLNETGSALWRLLAEPMAVEDAVVVFRDAFPDEDPGRVAEQVRDLIATLVEDDLVVELEEEA